MALNDALADLAEIECRADQVVELRLLSRFFNEETAEALGVSVRTVINDWNTARVWLHHQHWRRSRYGRQALHAGCRT